MSGKKLLLLILLFLPGIFWVFFEKVKFHSRRLNFYGPKEIIRAGDTVFYQVSLSDKVNSKNAVIIVPLHYRYRTFQYHFQSLAEAILYKPEKLRQIPIIFITNDTTFRKIFSEFLTHKKDVECIYMNDSLFSQNLSSLFHQKPYYVFDYFALLLDKNRHIRGYYNVQFTDEVKRMIQEYQHLRLKEETKSIKDEHTIEIR